MNDLAQKLKKSKPFSVWDAVVIAVFILLCCLPLLSLINRERGKTVKIVFDSEVQTYSLDADREIPLKDGAIVVRIENGEAWVSTSDCESGLCKRSGKISESGQSIVCLPNRLTVKIEGDGFDVSTGGAK